MATIRFGLALYSSPGRRSTYLEARGAGRARPPGLRVRKRAAFAEVCFVTVMVVTINMINWLFVTIGPFNSETVAQMNNEKTSSFCKAEILKNANLMMKEGSWLNYVQTEI